MERIAVGILGGTGYGAGELLRLLVSHGATDVVAVTSSSQAGESVESAHPHIAGFFPDLRFSEKLDFSAFKKHRHKFVFAALPHGKSAGEIAALLETAGAEDFKVIDLSGDFRLTDPKMRERHYPEAKAVADKLGSGFVYGLPELNRERIRTARLIANPGCLAAGCALAALPLAEEKLRGPVVFDAKTGSSGGGRAAADTMHHPHRHANVNAYKILEHRHEPEIRQCLGDPEGKRIETIFVPHLLPVSRGIFATAYLPLEREATTDELRARYEEFYRDMPFVRIRTQSPYLVAVIGSNFCDISVFARGRQAVAIAALDNLVKGMAGTAIQNMNLMAGLPEAAGLWAPAPSLV